MISTYTCDISNIILYIYIFSICFFDRYIHHISTCYLIRRCYKASFSSAARSNLLLVLLATLRADSFQLPHQSSI